MENLPVWQLGHPGRVIKILEIQHQVSINLINYQKIKEPAGKLSITDSITGSKLNNTTGKDQEGAVLGIRAHLDHHGSSR
jgi:hypothetical protein